MDKGEKIFVAGHHGMVGSAIVRRLKKEGFYNFVLKTSSQMDLRDQLTVKQFFETERPDYVFLAAAKVGGVHASNMYHADFIYDNLIMQANIIHQAFRCAAKKLLLLGGACIYPKLANQPMREETLMTGQLDATHEPFAIAKIAGIKMCQAYRHQYGCNFISIMPTNLYGPNDSYDLLNAHVLPALISKLHMAREQDLPSVEINGSGTPRREFLHVDDLAEACLFLMSKYNSREIINVGTGTDLSIKELALLIKKCVGYNGDLHFSAHHPDENPKKLLDTSKINKLGWFAKIELEAGIRKICKELKTALPV